MSILRIRNQETGAWEEIPAIVGPQGEQGERGPAGPQGERGESGFSLKVKRPGSKLTLALEHNTNYLCSSPVTELTITGFEPASDGLSEVWGIHFMTGDSIKVQLPYNVVWNCNAPPVFTPGHEYWLLFSALITGRVLGVWNEVEA